MWDLPGPGIEPVSGALAGRFLATTPPGKSYVIVSKVHLQLRRCGRLTFLQTSKNHSPVSRLKSNSVQLKTLPVPSLTSPVAQMVKRLPTMRETRVRSLGQEDSLEKEMATHSSTLAWTEEHGRLWSMGLQRVRHD